MMPGTGLTVDVPAAVIWKYHRGKAHGLMDVVLAPELQIETQHYADESRLEVTGSRGVIFVNRCTGRLQNRPPVISHLRRLRRVGAGPRRDELLPAQPAPPPAVSCSINQMNTARSDPVEQNNQGGSFKQDGYRADQCHARLAHQGGA
ncbi:MAG: hypothetical protein AB1767_01500 [Bacillota bacterium]